MKKIILKISLLLIASSFSLQLYPAASAAKEKTAEEVTPGGGAAPAEKSFSRRVKGLSDRLNETALYINKVEREIKEDEDTLNKWPAEDNDYKKILENSIATSKELLKTYRATLKRTHDAIKTAVEAERITREKKKTGTE